jgi:hypothetical protein
MHKLMHKLKNRLVALAAAAMLSLSPAWAVTPKHSGQAVEVKGHHLELVVALEGKQTHMDFYVLGPSGKPLPDANVRFQVITPDGRKLMLPLSYEPEHGHYGALLPSDSQGSYPKGQYKVVALTTVGGQKLNARYTFKL